MVAKAARRSDAVSTAAASAVRVHSSRGQLRGLCCGDSTFMATSLLHHGLHGGFLKWPVCTRIALWHVNKSKQGAHEVIGGCGVACQCSSHDAMFHWQCYWNTQQYSCFCLLRQRSCVSMPLNYQKQR